MKCGAAVCRVLRDVNNKWKTNRVKYIWDNFFHRFCGRECHLSILFLLLRWNLMVVAVVLYVCMKLIQSYPFKVLHREREVQHIWYIGRDFLITSLLCYTSGSQAVPPTSCIQWSPLILMKIMKTVTFFHHFDQMLFVRFALDRILIF